MNSLHLDTVFPRYRQQFDRFLNKFKAIDKAMDLFLKKVLNIKNLHVARWSPEIRTNSQSNNFINSLFSLFVISYLEKNKIRFITINQSIVVSKFFFVVNKSHEIVVTDFPFFVVLNRFDEFFDLLPSISSTLYVRFFAQIFCQSKNVTRNVTREKLWNQHLYEKFVRKMLMKLTPAV